MCVCVRVRVCVCVVCVCGCVCVSYGVCSAFRAVYEGMYREQSLSRQPLLSRLNTGGLERPGRAGHRNLCNQGGIRARLRLRERTPVTHGRDQRCQAGAVRARTRTLARACARPHAPYRIAPACCSVRRIAMPATRARARTLARASAPASPFGQTASPARTGARQASLQKEY